MTQPRRRHHDHSKETETDVAVRRLYVNAGDGSAAFGWDYPGRTLLQVRILRSTRRPATGADEIDAVAEGAGVEAVVGGAAAGRQVLVYQDVTGSFRDTGLTNGRPYFYSVFAREEGGPWHRWDDFEVTPGSGEAEPTGGQRDDAAHGGLFSRLLGRRKADQAGRTAAAAVVFVALLLAGLFALAALAAGVAGANGDEKEAAGDDVRAQARELALASPLVRDVAPESAGVSVALWPAAAGAAAPGATVDLSWPDLAPVAVDATLPVVRRDEIAAVPVPPYQVSRRHIVADGVTGLRVLVALPEERVLEVFPYDEHADFTVREDTSPPFSWLPWLTANPWALLPVFGAGTVYLGVRAWLRSRAWRRRLPSMSRHDRQFLFRLIIALLMGAAIALMVATIWRAASFPVPDPDRLVRDDPEVWPLILFPPLLYATALILELTSAPHRVAWSLVTLIAASSCVYLVVTMGASAVTDLTMLYAILLGCLTLVALPRAFAPGRTGWSRLEQPQRMF